MLDLLVFALAAAGCVALVSRVGRSLFRFGLAAARANAAAGLLEVSTRRGDLTAMAERREQASAFRRARLGSGLRLLLWIGALAAPPLLGWAREAYALASLVWLLPRPPLLPRGTDADAGSVTTVP